jgi:hypothetical protein
MFQTQINPAAIVQYISGCEAEEVQEFKSFADPATATPMELA